MCHCHPLEVLSRGSETQLQVGENLNKITWCVKGYTPVRVHGLKSQQRRVPSGKYS